MKNNDFNKVIQGILHMGVGTVIAQLINILAQPILTRLFSPEVLGIYTYYISLANVIIPISTLKIDMLIVSEKDETEAQYLTDVSIIINVITSIAYLLIILISILSSKENIFNKYGYFALLVPFLVFSNGLRFIFISYLNRYGNYKAISVVSVFREFSRGVIQVCAGFLNLGVLSLLFGFFIAPFFGLKFQIKNYLLKLKHRKFINFTNFKRIINEKAKGQILFLTPSQFINSFSSVLITISISELFNPKILGFYTSGLRVLEIPIIFITSNISKVLFQKLSENIANGKSIKNVFCFFTFALSILSILGFGLLYILAPSLTTIFFGKNYEGAGEYIRILIFMYGTRFIASSFSGVFTLFNKQNIELMLNLFLILTAFISYLLSTFYSLSVEQYLYLINGGFSIVYILLILLYFYFVNQYEENISKIF
ncbi:MULTISPECIES: oligosaccharide flippase family protein [unclassified Facklamia]|uniref:oligosaccharide flippase family protein n=1 Tax=Aerococcaceae TaxID=186827 RepID=UPI0013BD9DC3|nr:MULTISPECIES: oligosaccharide flippase family protein [unclassified Facklamia]MBS4462465.1 oligosaccharide flippase family protein [Aerococcaceae bacterium zg-B36]NEW65052.1 oligosaccharide flippase family protein [Facklamia sp. 252]NEW68709.1 oligosaccharide flippase family protein [Facklamia sp. 253]QQD65117.1 oligosaccharide flippase family protein [Aerococcaceae bacterium zg-252]